MTKYAKLTTGLVVAWFVFSLAASALHLYRNGPNQPPIAVGLAVSLPIVAFFVWFAASPGFRQFTLSLDPRLLTLVQCWRIAGFVFVVLAAYGLLPGLFAWPAGFGDIFIALTAPFVAILLATPARRGSFLVWQVLGIADLVNAVALGTLASVIDPHGISTSAMTVLPLSMIPTFGVPLLLIVHIISIAQARRWPAQRLSPIGEQLRSPAV